MADSLTFSLIAAYTTYAKHRLIRKTQQVGATQKAFLERYLAAHRSTELGQKFGLGQIETMAQFREQVPIYNYSFYEPYADRIAQGEQNILNPDPVKYINLTSGSTGNKKRVPVTARYQKFLRRADLASIGFMIAGLEKRGRPFGKALLTNNAQLQGLTPAGIPYGPVTAGSIREGKHLVDQLFSQPFAALEIGDIDSRHYVCLLFGLANPQLRGWVANFPMLILRTCAYLEQYAEALIEDLRTGAIAPWLNLDPQIRQQLAKRWRPHPQRADQLAAIYKANGRLTPQLAWPHLSYITTARGGTSDFYLRRFPDYFGDTPVFGGIYGTAEASFSVCPDLDSDAGILAIESGFFEFMPPDQWGQEQPQTRLPHELTVGERYRVLVTSYSGLYRYDIGDVVEVVGYYNEAPLIVFRHRYGGLLSSTTEKTTEFHTIQVMEKLQGEFGIKLDDFCITLSDGEFPARYVVNIELAPGHHLNNPQAFLQRFEYWLTEVNQPYGTVRSSQVPPPCLRVLAPGSFVQVRQRQIQRGMFDSQLKIPHITEDREFLTEFPVVLAVDWPGGERSP